VSRAEQEGEARDDAVLAALRAAGHGGLSSADLADQAGRSETACREAVRRLIDTGRARRDGLRGRVYAVGLPALPVPAGPTPAEGAADEREELAVYRATTLHSLTSALGRLDGRQRVPGPDSRTARAGVAASFRELAARVPHADPAGLDAIRERAGVRWAQLGEVIAQEEAALAESEAANAERARTRAEARRRRDALQRERTALQAVLRGGIDPSRVNALLDCTVDGRPACSVVEVPPARDPLDDWQQGIPRVARAVFRVAALARDSTSTLVVRSTFPPYAEAPVDSVRRVGRGAAAVVECALDVLARHEDAAAETAQVVPGRPSLGSAPLHGLSPGPGPTLSGAGAGAGAGTSAERAAPAAADAHDGRERCALCGAVPVTHRAQTSQGVTLGLCRPDRANGRAAGRGDVVSVRELPHLGGVVAL